MAQLIPAVQILDMVIATMDLAISNKPIHRASQEVAVAQGSIGNYLMVALESEVQ